MRVLVFGDSLTHGQFDSQGGWVERLKCWHFRPQIKGIATDETPYIYNLGIGGDTTAGLLQRFSAETTARNRQGDEPLALVFAIGINDSLRFPGTPDVSSPEQYGAELRQLYQLAEAKSSLIMFVGLTPMVESDLPGPLYQNERVWQFETVLRDFVQEKQVNFVPLFEVITSKLDAGEKLYVDGLHPNDQGHALIYEQVKPKLEDLIRS